MKRSYLKATILLSLISCIFLLNAFILKFINQFLLIIILIFFLGLIYLLFGFDNSHKRFEKDILLIISIYVIAYYVIIYSLGIIVGFTYNVYSLKIVSIMKNIFPILIIVVISELSRYNINSKIKNNNWLLFLSFVTFFLIDTTIIISKLEYNNFSVLLDNISLYIVPSLSKNLLLTYLSTKITYKPIIVYRLLMEIPIFLVPIFPNFGTYIESIIKLSIPIIILVRINNFYKKLPVNKEKIIIKKNYSMYVYILATIVLVTVIFLTSGIFKHQAIVIASGSMKPTFDRGDIVIVEKLSNQEKTELEEGSILAFRREGKLVIHRIYKKLKSGNEVFFETKGDNNENPDGYLIELNEIVGTSNIKIKYLGMPTIIIYDLFNR